MSQRFWLRTDCWRF